MGFLRRNIFILGLIGGVVVLGGIMLAMDLSTSGENDEQIGERTKVSADLRTAAQGKKVNLEMVDTEKQHVEKIRATAAQLAGQCAQWNRRAYHVMELPIKNERGEVVEWVKAFPMDPEKRGRGVILQLTKQYRKELFAMLTHMNSTQPPSEQDIAREQNYFQRRLEIQKAAQAKREQKQSALKEPAKSKTPVRKTSSRRPARRRAGEISPDEMEMMMMDEMMMSRKFGKGGGRGGSRRTPVVRPSGRPAAVSINVSGEANQKGLQSARIKKARGGEVYASIDSLDSVFLGESFTASDDEVWEAQVNLWVTGDIVEAIRQTNEQMLGRLPPEGRNVLKAPVKRLVSLDITEDYYTGGPAGLSGGRRGGSKATESSEFGFDELELEMMGWKGMKSRGRTAKVTKTAEAAETLTQRVCCKEYDVIHYTFTVVMPMRHLALLQENLSRRGNHTVLGVTIDKMDLPLSPSSRSGQAGSEDLYCYGTDPVTRITLMGELLLLTQWERGTRDEKTGEWSSEFPPLMPTEVLSDLNDRIPSAIRSEDQKRLSAAGGSTLGGRFGR